jgi:HSP20 family protein
MKFGLTRKENTVPDVRTLRNNMDRLFDDFFSLSPMEFFDSEWLPALDMYDDEKNIYIKADVAGIEEKDLNVTVQDNIMTISGQRSEEKKESGKRGCVISERRMGSFSRSISIPDNVKHENIKAELKNGVLNITLPKEKPAKSKEIKIDVK